MDAENTLKQGEVIGMLNNIELTDKNKMVLEYELGSYDLKDDPADKRDTIEDFIKGFSEYPADLKKEYKGIPQYTGSVQLGKGTPRRLFVLVPQGEWNVVYCC